MSFKVRLDPLKLNSALKGVTEKLEGIIKSRELYQEIGEFTVERVKYQARIKKPFNSTGSFPPLKESTKRHRRYLERHNPTHPTYESGRSNLTITGQFLDSLVAVADEDRVTIKYAGVHPGYKTGSGQGRSIKNETLAEYLAEKGFRAFDETLGSKQSYIKRIINITRQFIRRSLRTR